MLHIQCTTTNILAITLHYPQTIDATDTEKNQLTAKLDASQREVNLAK